MKLIVIDIDICECSTVPTDSDGNHWRQSNYSFIVWLGRLQVLGNATCKAICEFACKCSLIIATAVLFTSHVEGQRTPSHNPPPPADVGQFLIQQTDVTLVPNGSQQFSTMGLSAGVQVQWQVNGKQGGDKLVGTIESSGLYKAPSTIPTVPVSITAFVSDVSSATATVTIAQPPCTPQNGPCIRIAPNGLVSVGDTVSLNFVPKPGQPNSVQWFVNDVRNGNRDLGIVSTDGSGTAAGGECPCRISFNLHRARSNL